MSEACEGCKREFGDKLQYHASGRCKTCHNRKRLGIPDGPVPASRAATHCKKCFASFKFEKPFYSKRMCKQCYYSTGKYNKYEECRKCGFVFSQAKERLEKHAAHGLCRKCYDKSPWRKKSIKRALRKIKLRYKDKTAWYYRNREYILECRKLDRILKQLWSYFVSLTITPGHILLSHQTVVSIGIILTGGADGAMWQKTCHL